MHNARDFPLTLGAILLGAVGVVCATVLVVAGDATSDAAIAITAPTAVLAVAMVNRVSGANGERQAEPAATGPTDSDLLVLQHTIDQAAAQAAADTYAGIDVDNWPPTDGTPVTVDGTPPRV